MATGTRRGGIGSRGRRHANAARNDVHFLQLSLGLPCLSTFFCTGSFLAMPSVSYFQLFDPLHFFIAFYPGTI